MKTQDKSEIEKLKKLNEKSVKILRENYFKEAEINQLLYALLWFNFPNNKKDYCRKFAKLGIIVYEEDLARWIGKSYAKIFTQHQHVPRLPRPYIKTSVNNDNVELIINYFLDTYFIKLTL